MTLVEAWRMDETGQNTRVGQLGVGCDLAVTAGTAGNTTGKLGNAIFGTSYTIGKTDGIGSLGSIRSGDLSIVFWIRRDDAATFTHTMTLKRTATSAGFYISDSNGSGSSVTAFGTGSVSRAPSLLVNGVWMFRAITWNLATKVLTLYDDNLGSVLQTAQGTGATVAFPADFDSFTIAGVNITVDQLMIYNEVLAPNSGTNTLNQLWNNGNGYDPTAVVASSGSPINFGNGNGFGSFSHGSGFH